MTPEQERWAEALAVHRMYGQQAAEHVAERIGGLAVVGDQDGIDRWIEIARRLVQLPFVYRGLQGGLSKSSLRGRRAVKLWPAWGGVG